MTQAKDSSVATRGAEDARNELPQLLQAAEQGRATVITRRGRPVAALVPMSVYEKATQRQQPLGALAGSGAHLWGADSRRTLRKLRDDEWNR